MLKLIRIAFLFCFLATCWLHTDKLFKVFLCRSKCFCFIAIIIRVELKPEGQTQKGFQFCSVTTIRNETNHWSKEYGKGMSHISESSEIGEKGDKSLPPPQFYAIVFCICNVKKFIVPVVFIAVTKSSLQGILALLEFRCMLMSTVFWFVHGVPGTASEKTKHLSRIYCFHLQVKE